METVGFLSPSTPEEARETHRRLGPTAQTLVKEVARAMELDAEEYDRRVTEDIVAAAHDALFSSLLTVSVGTREEFAEWREDFDGEVTVVGGDVDNVAWHAFDGAAVGATYQNEREAAVATLRRQAYGRLYRGLLRE